MLALFLLLCLPGVARDTIPLPPALPYDAAMQPPASAHDWQVQTGGIVSGDLNVGSLWQYNKKHQPNRILTADDANAAMSCSGWMYATSGHWLLCAGSGQQTQYRGNRDAGQLWIDLHADNAPTRDYAPVVEGTELACSWVGVGRELPLHCGPVRGAAWVMARRLDATRLLTRTGNGTMVNKDFTGMVRTIASAGTAGSVRGTGWAVDAGARMRVGEHWEALGQVEGLRGAITWRQAFVDDNLIVSPRTFEDPDGFLHGFGGITGAAWRDNLRLALEPSCQLDMLYHGAATAQAGVTVTDGRALPRLGGIFLMRGSTFILRAYPTRPALEIGAAGRGWLISLRADKLPTANPSVGAFTLQLGPLVF